jgi:CelD/BcsL family acetyltransferase involved in cellulose biosynthesis
MRIDLIQPNELGPSEIAAWHSMQEATPTLANPFLSPEFTLAAGRLRQESRVAVLRDGACITGFFPFERRRFGVGVPIAGWLSACQGLIHTPAAEWDAEELLRSCDLAVWKFDNLIFNQKPFAPYQIRTTPSPILDLSSGFDHYYTALRSKRLHFCRELERKTRKLRRESGDLHVVCDSRDSSILRTLIAWKSQQYRRTAHVDRFQQPWICELLEKMLETRTKELSGLLSVLYAGDQPVAAQFGLRNQRKLVGWFTGYDISYAKYSPGLIHLMLMARELTSASIEAIHMGKGALKYAQPLKNGDILVSDGVVTAQSTLGIAYDSWDRASRFALNTVRRHPALHSTLDMLLRQGGIANRIYGRI